MPGKREDYLSWKECFMGTAILASTRSKDPSTQVGACIVKDNKILSLGYNGLPRGMHDDLFYWNSIGETTGEKEKIKDPFVVHAERNAILNYRGSLKDLENSTLYVTLFPCSECTKEIIQVGIKKVVWLRMFGKEENVKMSMMMLEKAGIEVEEFGKNVTKEDVLETNQTIQNAIKKLK